MSCKSIKEFWQALNNIDLKADAIQKADETAAKQLGLHVGD